MAPPNASFTVSLWAPSTVVVMVSGDRLEGVGRALRRETINNGNAIAIKRTGVDSTRNGG